MLRKEKSDNFASHQKLDIKMDIQFTTTRVSFQKDRQKRKFHCKKKWGLGTGEERALPYILQMRLPEKEN